MATINYNGMELEVFNPDKSVAFDPPIKCVGWNNEDVKVEFELSSALSKDIWIHRFIGKSNDAPVAFMFCAILIDPPKPRRATNRELSRWLAQGNGEWGISKFGVIEKAEIGWFYDTGYEKQTLQSELRVRKWSDYEWHEPTVDYLFGGDDADR